MRFPSAKSAIEWAYTYCHLVRSAKGINYPKKKDMPPPDSYDHDHALHVLAIRLLEMVGGYLPPDEANETILGYYVGWIRWTSLSGKEQYRVRKTNSTVETYLKDEGLLA